MNVNILPGDLSNIDYHTMWATYSSPRDLLWAQIHGSECCPCLVVTSKIESRFGQCMYVVTPKRIGWMFKP